VNEHRTRTNRRDDWERHTGDALARALDADLLHAATRPTSTPAPAPTSIRGRATPTGTTRPQGER